MTQLTCLDLFLIDLFLKLRWLVFYAQKINILGRAVYIERDSRAVANSAWHFFGHFYQQYFKVKVVNLRVSPNLTFLAVYLNRSLSEN